MSAWVVGVVLACFALRLAVEGALDLLELGHLSRAGDLVPPALAGRLDAATALRSRRYALAKGRLGLAEGLADAGLTLALLFSGLLPALDASLARHGLQGAHRAVAFLALLALASALAGLPFSLLRTFRLERRFGFNRTTPALWLEDRAKGLALAAAVGLPLLYAGYALFTSAGRAWWLWLFALLAAVQLGLAVVWPALLAPLFNRFEPLPEGPLRARLTALAEAARFRTGGLFVVDASRRSGHANAWFAGLLRPRIVLFDTLLRELDPDEVAAVLAHEIGHFKARHVHLRLALGLGLQLAGLWALSLLAAWPPLHAAFGFPEPSFHAVAALFALGGGAFTFWLTPLASWLSRRHERAADRLAVALSGGPAPLRSALLKLAGQNLSDPDPHPWYSAWHHSHPPLLARLAALDQAGRRGAA